MADPQSRTGVVFHADGAILDFLAKLHAPHDAPLAQAFGTPERAGLPAIMVGPAEGKLLGLLLRLVRARRVVEIGTSSR